MRLRSPDALSHRVYRQFLGVPSDFKISQQDPKINSMYYRIITIDIFETLKSNVNYARGTILKILPSNFSTVHRMTVSSHGPARKVPYIAPWGTNVCQFPSQMFTRYYKIYYFSVTPIVTLFGHMVLRFVQIPRRTSFPLWLPTSL